MKYTPILLTFIIVLFSGCKIKAPIFIQASELRVIQQTSDSLEIKASLTFENPNKFDLILKAFDGVISINDMTMSNILLEYPVNLSASSKVDVPIVIQTDANKLPKIVFITGKTLLGGKPATFRLQGKLTGKRGWYNVHLNVDESAEIH